MSRTMRGSAPVLSMRHATESVPASSVGSLLIDPPPSIPVPVTSARSSSRHERGRGLTRPALFLLYHAPIGDKRSYQPGIVAPDRARADARGRSQIVDRWQPRVSDEEKGRNEQPDRDGRDERSVEGVEAVASAPRHWGAPWRDRWPRRHGDRPTRRGPTGGCTIPRGILATRPSHAPSPSHPCPTLPVPADVRAPASRAPVCPARVPRHVTIIPHPTRAVHPLGKIPPF